MRSTKRNYIWEGIKDPSIVFTLTIGGVVIGIIFLLDFIYKPDFLDILVEAHGLVFDIILFGLIIALYDVVRRRKEDKQREEIQEKQLEARYREEIDDYRGWYSDEAKFRILGNIKRLSRIGVFNLNLEECYLVDCKLESIELYDVTFYLKCSYNNLDFSRIKAKKCLFRSNMIDSKFTLSEFSGSTFESMYLDKLKCKICDFSDTSFRRVTMSNCRFDLFSLAEFQSIESLNKWIENVTESTYLERYAGLSGAESIQTKIVFDNSTFVDSKINNTIFDNCSLKNVQFNNCTFDNTEFINCDLEDSNIIEYKGLGVTIVK